MTAAQPQQKARRAYQMHGHYKRVRALKRRGYSAIDGRTYAGREAKRWRGKAIDRKGGGSCPFNIRFDIDAAMFDLWLLLELADTIAVDAKKRGTALNRRAKALPKIHEQYKTIAERFAKRCEALELDKGPGRLDLARRIQLEQMQRVNGDAR